MLSEVFRNGRSRAQRLFYTKIIIDYIYLFFFLGFLPLLKQTNKIKDDLLNSPCGRHFLQETVSDVYDRKLAYKKKKNSYNTRW